MDKTVFSEHLYNVIIPFWKRMSDNVNGGFYGYADHNGIPDKQGVKGVILQSRILWFFSSAYILLKDRNLLYYADHAFSFLKDHCYDRKHGGMYWSVNYDGTPCEDMKHTYCQSFAVYALSAYYRAGGCREALDMAYNLYHTIEHKCTDDEGYLEAFEVDFSPASNDKLSENGVMAERTMNTLLHLLECYTELLRAGYSSGVEDSVKKILSIFRTRVYNPELQRCEVFFDLDYRSLLDLESYGHDIEASWLISRACEVLNDSAVNETMMPVITGLAKGAFDRGIDRQNHAMNNECENGIVDRKKVWWVQAEAVTGFYNAYSITGNIDYLNAADRVWDYISSFVVDNEHGEWIENIYEDGNEDTEQPLVHSWKCPYHNGRMCIEMVLRMKAELGGATDKISA